MLSKINSKTDSQNKRNPKMLQVHDYKKCLAGWQVYPGMVRYDGKNYHQSLEDFPPGGWLIFMEGFKGWLSSICAPVWKSIILYSIVEASATLEYKMQANTLLNCANVS